MLKIRKIVKIHHINLKLIKMNILMELKSVMVILDIFIYNIHIVNQNGRIIYFSKNVIQKERQNFIVL